MSRTPHKPNQFQAAHLKQAELLELPAHNCAPEELCQQVVFMLEMVLTQHKLDKGWSTLHQCAAINHLTVMRTHLPQGTALDEVAYFQAALHYADNIRSTRSVAIGHDLRGRTELLPALEQVNAVVASFPKSALQDAGMASAEAMVLVEAYTSAASARVLGIDAAEIWPVPKYMWQNLRGLKEWTL